MKENIQDMTNAEWVAFRNETQRVHATKEQITKAINDADYAFWKAVNDAFPMATGGDFPPDADSRFNDAAREAIRTWVEINVPAQPVRALECWTCNRPTMQTLTQDDLSDGRQHPIIATCPECQCVRALQLEDIFTAR